MNVNFPNFHNIIYLINNMLIILLTLLVLSYNMYVFFFPETNLKDKIYAGVLVFVLSNKLAEIS